MSNFATSFINQIRDQLLQQPFLYKLTKIQKISRDIHRHVQLLLYYQTLHYLKIGVHLCRAYFTTNLIQLLAFTIAP